VLVHAGPRPWAEALDLDDGGLDDLDPAACLRQDPPGLGRQVAHPLVLVCTHGRRDRCCAVLGRPVAEALALHAPEAVWETSHVGGHRFAGNVVLLPEGLVFGGLDPAGALAVLARHAEGRLALSALRGRSALEPVAQAAEVLVRERLGLDAVGGVTVLASTGDGARAEVTLAVAGRRLRTWLEVARPGPPRRLSCDASAEEDPPTYRLLRVEDDGA
jgi:hypothetical protein